MNIDICDNCREVKLIDMRSDGFKFCQACENKIEDQLQQIRNITVPTGCTHTKLQMIVAAINVASNNVRDEEVKQLLTEILRAAGVVIDGTSGDDIMPWRLSGRE